MMHTGKLLVVGAVAALAFGCFGSGGSDGAGGDGATAGVGAAGTSGTAGMGSGGTRVVTGTGGTSGAGGGVASGTGGAAGSSVTSGDPIQLAPESDPAFAPNTVNATAFAGPGYSGGYEGITQYSLGMVRQEQSGYSASFTIHFGGVPELGVEYELVNPPVAGNPLSSTSYQEGNDAFRNPNGTIVYREVGAAEGEPLAAAIDVVFEDAGRVVGAVWAPIRMRIEEPAPP